MMVKATTMQSRLDLNDANLHERDAELLLASSRNRLGVLADARKHFLTVRTCVQCDLSLSRGLGVPGEGDIDARVVFVGEAPGRHNDAQGKPFVGQGGELLATVLQGIQLTRPEVFLTNVVCCRPPKNRRPLPKEINACMEHLKHILALVRPKLIVALGATASESLLGRKVKLKDEHGRVIDVDGIGSVCLTYHPSSVRYNPRVITTIVADIRQGLTRLSPSKEENGPCKP